PAGPYASGLTVRTPEFESQMRYLAENGYHAVTLADLAEAFSGGRPLPGKPVVLTFDDGGLDNYSVAFPILKKYGLTATFFVITGRVGASGQMDWDDLRTMATQGMSIESHTISHPDLRVASDERLRLELEKSRADIAAHIGTVPYAVAYPAGAFDQRVIEATRAAGYLVAVATDKGTAKGPDALYELKRRRVVPFLSVSQFARLVK
ncbi:MAG: polysaccharide deacetylase family protein, partial [Thermoleophilia bacterium]|nr:polysaccharide deacetylase family protein [Thermoleophilia bacterium]